MKIIILCFVISLSFMNFTYADKNSRLDILDKYIEEQCTNYKGEYEKEKMIEYHKGYTSLKRCILIGQAQMRFETNGCLIGNGEKNNCFGFRGGKNLQWEKEYNMFFDGTGSYYFSTDKDSIRFFVDRFYKYDLYKTVSQIIKGGSYISPRTGKKVSFEGFSRTNNEVYENYIFSVKKYIFDNK